MPEFNEQQLASAHRTFVGVFDKYLKSVSPNTYPHIYHMTGVDNLESIKKHGLTSKRNYFLEYDNDLNQYGFDENDEEAPGVACVVDYRAVADRLYPDPEWLIGYPGGKELLQKVGNPNGFDKNRIDDRVLCCMWLTDIMNMPINATPADFDSAAMKRMTDDNMFAWTYIKGPVAVKDITFELHPDLEYLGESINAERVVRKTVYHGTPDARFSEIKNSLAGQLSDDITVGNKGVSWFTDNRHTAKTYADPKRAFDYQNAEPKVLVRRITIKNPLVVDAKGRVWRKAEFNIDGQRIVGTHNLVNYAKNNGYDGIVVNNVYDNYNHFKGEGQMRKYLANTYAVFSDNQIEPA